MSVTLTAEQFQLLLNSVSNGNNQPTKITKTIIKENSNAQNFEDFVDNLEYLSVKKLMNMNIIEFISNTIKHNIDSLEETEYPIVCTNIGKKLFYYKSKNEWKKGTEFIKILYNKIVKRAYKDLTEKYNEKYIDDVNEEDNEKKYSSSKDAEKQQILLNLCHIDKYSYETVYDKVLVKVAKNFKTEFMPEK